MKLNHIAIAYKDIGMMAYFLEKILEIKPESPIIDRDQNINTLAFKTDGSEIHLIEPISEDSPISNFLEKRGEGLHHIAIEVEDVSNVIEYLKKKDVHIIREPKIEYDGRKIAFIDPKSACNVLVELIEKKTSE
jgi:methylmalonyl-CoA epimerase